MGLNKNLFSLATVLHLCMHTLLSVDTSAEENVDLSSVPVACDRIDDSRNCTPLMGRRQEDIGSADFLSELFHTNYSRSVYSGSGLAEGFGLLFNVSDEDVEENGTEHADTPLEPDSDGMNWRMKIKIVCVPIFTLIGLFGNGLSFIVMFSPVYHKKSYTYYLRALAVFDTLTLIVTLVITFNEFHYAIIGTSYMNGHNWLSCKVSEFLRHVIYLMSSWMVVLFTVDRYIAVCHPLQRARICTATGAIITIFVLFGLAMMTQIYIFTFIDRLEQYDEQPCHVPVWFRRSNTTMEWMEKDTTDRLKYFALNYFWFSFILRFTLPFVIIAVCNGLIMFHIRRMRTQKCPHNSLGLRSCFSNQEAKERERKRNANMAIYTLFAVCSLFVITLLPNAIITMVQFVGYLSMTKKDSKSLYQTLMRINTPFQMIRLINYSMNFVMYGLTGRQFRREAKKLLTCRFKMCTFNEKVRDFVLQNRLLVYRNEQQ